MLSPGQLMTDSGPEFPNDRTLLDRTEAGTISAAEFEAAIVDQVYAGMQRYCEIPDAYQHCELCVRELDVDALADDELRGLLRARPAEIINPDSAHIKAIELFDMLLEGDAAVCERVDPLSPSVGAYLYGPPGLAKPTSWLPRGAGFASCWMRSCGMSTRGLVKRCSARSHGTFGAAYSESRATEDNVGYTMLTENGHSYENKSAPADEFW